MKENVKAFGIITRDLNKREPIEIFLENTRKFKHQMQHLIVSYEDEVDNSILDSFKKQIKVTAVKRGHAPFLENYLSKLGLTEEEVMILTGTPYKNDYGLISYGTSRNYVLLTAFMLKVDYLFFFDSDIYPKILTHFTDDSFSFTEIDFVGSHLKYLKQKDVVLTTSDYSGYYIIPKMNFPHLKDLLYGVQKETAFDKITKYNDPVTAETYLQKVIDTQKALGGNLAINLNKINVLPPFFSSAMVMNDECFLGRGEDTLFGPEIHKKARCVDIDLPVFHNCFGDFPKKPSIFLEKNLDRFFYACMGWIIRNPFLNWLRQNSNMKYDVIEISSRLKALKIGSRAAAEYFNDDRFLMLPAAFELSYQKLANDIWNFRRLMKTWKKFMKLNLQEHS
ncbi:MAG: hypothetical protein K9N07_09245 [Candidatus Cloacimonetes bacterium]|nr:hypothetical protein [Candidatus Cloacimonadota bacterium]